MKAIVLRDFGPLGNATLEDLAAARMWRTEICIQVEAVAANFVDISW